MKKFTLFLVAVMMSMATFAQSQATKIQQLKAKAAQLKNAPRKAGAADGLGGTYVLQYESLTAGVATGGNSVDVTVVDDETITITGLVPNGPVTAYLEDGTIYIEPQEVADGLTLAPLNSDKAYDDEEPTFVAVDDFIEGLYDVDEGLIFIMTPYAVFNASNQVTGLAYGESFMLKANGVMSNDGTANSTTVSVVESYSYGVYIEQSGSKVYVTNFGNYGQQIEIDVDFAGNITLNCLINGEFQVVWDDVTRDLGLWKYNGARQGNTLLGAIGGSSAESLVFSDEGGNYGYIIRPVTALSLAKPYIYRNTVISYTNGDSFSVPEAPAATPGAPSNISVGAYDDDPEEGEFNTEISFTLSLVDTNYQNLDTNHLFYKVYTEVNGKQEVLSFRIGRQQTELIPATVGNPNADDYSSDDDITWTNNTGGRKFVVDGNPRTKWERIGVQSIYTAGGEEHASSITWSSYLARYIQLDAQGWATYSGSSVLDFTAAEADAYTLKVDGDYGILTNVPKIPSNAGVVVKGEPGAAVLIPVGSGRVTLTNNDLVAVTNARSQTVEANSVLVLGNVDGVEGFYTFSGTTIPLNKAYLRKPATAGANGIKLVFEGDETTAIRQMQVEAGTADKAVYNLNGQRVSASYKGVVIRNGKKVVIK